MMATIIVTGVIIMLVILDIRYMVHMKKTGKSIGCSGCSGNCAQCHAAAAKKKSSAL
ncbi:MAG: FeoB-associated Cys-rich membrane protein [Butyrivibrio sp.]|jgi:mono/diheme cytochrome c family protein|nr:FeoB-associated Cys-rich membrane protein [Butyrivibrio sp.]